MAPSEYRARTYFLNEQHELTHGERSSGGRTHRYAPIDWKEKGARLSGSLKRVQNIISASTDPAKNNHYFILSKPEKEIVKVSDDKSRAPDGILREPVHFGDQHSRLFGRLEMDLLQVREDGSALVHLTPTALEKLTKTSDTLNTLGAREQSRWVAFAEFGEVPSDSRLDVGWVQSLDERSNADSVIEFQPFLSRVEIDNLLRSIVEHLRNAGERIYSSGTDFSGRQWLRGAVLPRSLRALADSYFSIQSLHSPLIAHTTLAAGGGVPTYQSFASPQPVNQLPVIAVVDTGVPTDQASLAQFRRGTYIAPNSYSNNPDPHGTFVSSRVVFGPIGPSPTAGVLSAGSSLFYDINICGINQGEVDTKSLYPALQAVTATAPDVRVFNCSFDTSSLPIMS